MNTRQLLSVGIDIGTTTTQVIFSHLELVNRAAVSQVPRYEFIKREISWQSPVFFTPVDKQGGLKEAELKTLILEQYQAAGIAPESVDSGAIIITGESAKTRNARPAVMALSQSLGDFVVASAGPHLESVIAGHGAGAQTLSEQRLCRVLNIDIGGGTANYALFDAGKISGTACLNVGGRLLETDSQGRFKTISPHIHRKILRFFYLVVGLVVALAAVEMAQIILTGGSSIMESISKYLIYSNSYVLNFIKFGGKRTTALYFEPAFFALALISIWLSIKQFGIKTPKTDAMILAGIILSGSFSGVMTFILFYLLEWAFQYLNKEAIKKKLPLALISLAVFLVGVVIAFPYISTRLGDLGKEGSSSYYRIVGPLVMVGYSLTHIDGVVRFGSLYEYVASFGIFNGADVGKTIDNGLYLLIIYFSWFAVFLSLWYMGKVIKMMINAFGDNRNFRVQLYLFTPVSLFFTGSIFSPEYAFLIVCPFILRKALNITR